MNREKQRSNQSEGLLLIKRVIILILILSIVHGSISSFLIQQFSLQKSQSRVGQVKPWWIKKKQFVNISANDSSSANTSSNANATCRQQSLNATFKNLLQHQFSRISMNSNSHMQQVQIQKNIKDFLKKGQLNQFSQIVFLESNNIQKGIKYLKSYYFTVNKGFSSIKNWILEKPYKPTLWVISDLNASEIEKSKSIDRLFQFFQTLKNRFSHQHSNMPDKLIIVNYQEAIKNDPKAMYLLQFFENQKFFHKVHNFEENCTTQNYPAYQLPNSFYEGTLAIYRDQCYQIQTPKRTNLSKCQKIETISKKLTKTDQQIDKIKIQENQKKLNETTNELQSKQKKPKQQLKKRKKPNNKKIEKRKKQQLLWQDKFNQLKIQIQANQKQHSEQTKTTITQINNDWQEKMKTKVIQINNDWQAKMQTKITQINNDWYAKMQTQINNDWQAKMQTKITQINNDWQAKMKKINEQTKSEVQAKIQIMNEQIKSQLQAMRIKMNDQTKSEPQAMKKIIIINEPKYIPENNNEGKENISKGKGNPNKVKGNPNKGKENTDKGKENPKKGKGKYIQQNENSDQKNRESGEKYQGFLSYICSFFW